MNKWVCLVTSLPTENAALRQRVWRALKAAGVAVLRDGVYLLPSRPACQAVLESLAAEVTAGCGTAWVLRVEEPAGAHFQALFDRTEAYAELMSELALVQANVSPGTLAQSQRLARKWRKAFVALGEIDFFPGAARQQADAALKALEVALARVLSPDEPSPVEGELARLDVAGFQHQTWATRRRPWVDRLASAWLIRRFIDPQARILWLDSPADCPADALGFDFDGAVFSHVGGRVTFEVLAASFGLSDPALQRLGQLVHYLDVGGVPSPEASGVESVLAGLRTALTDDDQLLASASHVFDGLLAAFHSAGNTE